MDPHTAFPRLPLATALRKSLRAGYGAAELRADVLAGAVVGVVAVPLSMALAIASGVPPQYGLYTAIVAGVAIALTGGARLQVSGPTAAFVVVLVPVTNEFGVGGLLVATLMAGVILVGMGIGKLGRLIEYVPYPVTTGFTAGIAVVIATLQLRDALGLEVAEMPESYTGKVAALAQALPSVSAPDVAIAALTLLLLATWHRVTVRVPGPLVALLAGTGASLVLGEGLGFDVATLRSEFSWEIDGVIGQGIPALPPTPALPWRLPGPDGAPLAISFELLRALLGPAFAIAMLGAIESLLSAVVADGVTGDQHDPDAELVGQGIGNLLAPFFGGFAATGALARTATNIRSGARTPLAAVFHALFVLAVVLVLAPALGYVPMAALAALLLMVAWNMSEARHFLRALRTAPRGDVVVQLTCFGLTVMFDMVIAISVGVVMAALLFMRRMTEVTGARLVSHTASPGSSPVDGIVVFEVAGPLFFGAAHKAMATVTEVGSGVRAVVIDLVSVPVIDATGVVNLRSSIDRLASRGVPVVLARVQDEPAKVLRRAGLMSSTIGPAASSLDDAQALAREKIAGLPSR